MKTKAAAEYLGMCTRRLIELTKAGKISGLRDGKDVKYTVVELERYIRDLPSYEPVSA